MAMSADVLAAAVAAEFGVTAEPTEFMKKFCKVLIQHIQTQAQIAGACVGLANGGGPVTGTALLPPGSIK